MVRFKVTYQHSQVEAIKYLSIHIRLGMSVIMSRILNRVVDWIYEPAVHVLGEDVMY